MDVGDELFELRAQRSKGRIGHGRVLPVTRPVDDSPLAIPDRNEAIVTCARRIEALLEDKLGASGIGLDQKIESAAGRIPPDLRSELRSIAASQKAISRGDALAAEIGGLQSRCADALLKTLHLAEAASQPDPSIR